MNIYGWYVLFKSLMLVCVEKLQETRATLLTLLDGPGVTHYVYAEYKDNEELRQSIIDNFRSTCQDQYYYEGSNTNPVTIPFNNMGKDN